MGAEREYRDKAAGFRTTIMISFGACFFTLMPIAIGGSNPDRIAANIVTGIGFLGAGIIFRGDSRVNGINTAATIWAVAAVGIGLGAGFYLASGCASALILFVLSVLPAAQKTN
ncbi:MgtC/SapB family protein [Mucilaginibacter sp. CSA2-8R]|uniref:MgtC/SapB family protein n=1 Tax=Mucilaginibacter sp. CSA2-8R TaxID=3141542 RepID=UPI00315DD714